MERPLPTASNSVPPQPLSIPSINASVTTRIAAKEVAEGRTLPPPAGLSLATIAQGMREGLVILDAANRVEHLNPAAERILRLGEAELAGTCLWSEATRLEREALERACEQARSEQEPVELEAFFPPDRTWLDFRFCPQGDQILVYFLQRTFRRSTDQIVAEHLERFELISQTTTDVIWDWNLLDNRLWRSEGSADFIDPTQTAQPESSEAWLAAIVDEDRERIKGELRTILIGSETCGAMSYQMRRRDGRVVHLVERVLVIRDHRDRAVRAIGCIRDVSEQKQLEAQLRRAQRLETIGRIAGGIAHDLNNILTPISMALDLLALDVNDSQERRVTESLQQSIAHGASLLQILLMFGRGSEAEKTALDPRQVSRDVIQIARETFPASVTLEEHYTPDLPAIRGNSTQLRQVLLNLVMNARDAMEGQGRIAIRIHEHQLDASAAEIAGVRSGNYVVISVSDNGPGIPAEILDNIWDPFFTTKPEGKGTGLGLSTASAIINAHGGAIQVTSKSGEGTTFLVYLPASDELAAPARDLHLAVPAAAPSSRTILFADEDQGVRQVAGRILEKRGFQVKLASVGAEILDHFQGAETAIDLLIINLKLPLPEGSTLVTSIRDRHPRLPIIATSDYRADTSLPPPLQRSVNAFILKPFTGVELLAAVDRGLNAIHDI